ncbi:MAG: ADP-glyceromanno-heptose 6-epimerase [bacterium]|nr:ADP-glyceromanno-heptose 6-epimerase [bacterium]
MIVVTGAAGFIGSCLISKLNSHNFNYIIAVDDFSNIEKNRNLEGKQIQQRVEREEFFDWLDLNFELVEFIFHLGARTDTTENNYDLLKELNYEYSKKIWKSCVSYQIPLVYASSAATYGNGESGYEDIETNIPNLKPLNAYGKSKNEFDKWVLNQEEKPFFWAGLKFFNVYGPNEYHKGRMASVVYHAYRQLAQEGKVTLFKSHNSDYLDGEQSRDFIYVQDVVDTIYWFLHHRKDSGIYNLGSGEARTFLDLAQAVFSAMNSEKDIQFKDTPEEIRENYQYFTEAKMDKLKSIGCTVSMTSLEDGIEEYITQYLKKGAYL